ncbi:type 1 fimbrial protein, partial [Enterobacter bugandensis]
SKNGTSSPRAFDIKLEGCDISGKHNVTAAFSGTADGDDLALMGGTAAGASIVIHDSMGAPIKINTAAATTGGEPLEAGTTTLHFSAFLKASKEVSKIKTGDFTSVATFALNYQ